MQNNIPLAILTVPEIRNIFREEFKAFFGTNFLISPISDNDQIFNSDEAALFLNLKKQTLYRKVRRREVPVNKKGNKLYFSKAELTQWVKDGRKLTNQELDAKASNICRSKK